MHVAVVSTYEILGDHRNKRYVSFNVRCDLPNAKYAVKRRFNEFRCLNSYLAKAFPECRFKLPPRRIFGSSFDAEFLRIRSSGLDSFVADVSSVSYIMSDKCVFSFFADDIWESPLESSGSVSERSSSPDLCSNEANMSSVSTSSSSSSSLIRSVFFRTMSYFSKPKATSSTTSACRRCVSEPLIEALTDDFSRIKTPTSLSNHGQRKLSVDDFNFIKTIGKGSFGKVYLVQFKVDRKIYAMKVISKDLIKEEADYRHIMSERKILSQDMQHPFLIKLKCAFQSESKLFIVMQYVNGGEIFFHLQKDLKFTELRAKFYAAEIVSAFAFLHSKGIVYRDLKPENILLDAEGHIVLVDFGLAKNLVNLACTSTFCGTPEYLAPEVILNKKYGKPIDWWCLGSVLYEMLTGLPPFYSKSRAEIFDKVVHQQVNFHGTSISQDAQDFIMQLMKKSPDLRLGSGPNGSEDVKSHPFFAGIDWHKIYQKRYQAPFTPKIDTEYGLENFDPEFLRESISTSVYDQPWSLEELPLLSPGSTSPLLSSEYDEALTLSSSSHTDLSSTSSSTDNGFMCQNFTKLWNHPSDRQMLFIGFSYGDTIEL